MTFVNLFVSWTFLNIGQEEGGGGGLGGKVGEWGARESIGSILGSTWEHPDDVERDMQAHRVCVAVCCSVLQCVAVCCSVLQCVAVRCSVL